MHKLVLTCLLGLGPLGCSVGLAEASVAPTGCAEEEIRISHAHTPFLGQGAPAQWTATCDGVRYYCTQTRDRTICSQDPRPEPAPARATGKSKPKKATESPVARANIAGKPKASATRPEHKGPGALPATSTVASSV